MPGSRKGERRGGAVPGRVRRPGNPALRKGGPPLPGAGRKKGSKNKPKHDPALVSLLNSPMAPARREQELELYFQVVGRRLRMPREVMLDAMRYFEETGIQYGEVVRANMRAARSAEGQDRQIFDGAAVEAENRMREYIMLSVDVAGRVAPFLHPRLAAMISAPGGDRSPTDVLRQLAADLDEAGKPANYIDHDPGEVVK
jgi:hypothetical protein